MKIYLMRHCLAEEGDEMDAERGLTDVGEKQTKVMRKFLKRANVRPDIIISSDFVRAVATAEGVLRKKTEYVQSPALRPDGTPPSAWKAVRKLAGDAKAVLVVTHGPLVQQMLASVAFCFLDEDWEYPHGSVAYINTHQGKFRWFVDPKLAAHLVGKKPKSVENPLDAEFAGATKKLAEHLLKSEKATIVDPLIAKLTTAVALRFRRQYAKLKAAVQSGSPIQATMLHLRDPQFAKVYLKVTAAAYQGGAQHTAVQLGVRLSEAAKTPIARLPGPTRTAADLEDDLDETTQDRIANVTKSAFAQGMTIAGVLGVVGAAFADMEDSRAATIAVGEVSDAFHAGGLDVAEEAGDIEKRWEAQPDACEICEDNEMQGWIDSDEEFDSGDDAPPAHPNCRCSIAFRKAAEEE